MSSRLALGLADRALAEMVRHLRSRVQFGKPLADQQGLQFALADVATDHVAAQLLVYRAATARDEGRGTPDQALVRTTRWRERGSCRPEL